MLVNYNQFINQFSNNVFAVEPMWDEIQTATVTTPTANTLGMQRLGQMKELPALPANVTAYIVTQFSAQSSLGTVSMMLAKLINLGSLTLGDGAGGASSFADGVAMPTVTELGSSVQIPSPVICEVTTLVTATPGTFTITYQDQDGNSSETTAAQTPGANAPLRSAGTIVLNGSDWGVIDISDAARSAGTNPGGVIKFWGIVPIGIIASPNSAPGNVSKNLLTMDFNPVRLGAGDVLGCFTFGTVTTKAMMGMVTLVGDT